ncbi:MAG: aminotransferase class V-fold PLP-dependent enzyme [Opitutae bacterium]|nr:aminotransferase class V-fold PLP-dependent enzyme [Opitutae bacterium]
MPADVDRRQWIKTAVAGAVGVVCAQRLDASAPGPAAPKPTKAPGGLPSSSTLAGDDADWAQVQRSFVVGRDIVALNHAGAGCCPQPVLEAVEHYVHEVETLPSWNLFQYGPKEPIRAGLARMFACDSEEVAILRNATEALDIVLLGLPLRAGDEVLTTTLDYWAMLDALDQRVKRDGIVVKKVRMPVPANSQDELFDAFASAVTDRTRLILVSHPVNLTGQHFPVARICEMAHARGIEVLVDAAQSFGQFEVTAGSLQCDYMGTSLHKWLMGPKGTGMLYVKREKIPKLWPLFPAGATLPPDNIRKFEQIGTAPMTMYALSEAIQFHQAIGTVRIGDRLRALTQAWTDPLRANERFEFRTSFAPGMSNVIATFHLKGTSSGELWERLFKQEKFFTFNVARRTQEFQGIRISVGLSTTAAEIDRFVTTMLRLARDLPVAH